MAKNNFDRCLSEILRHEGGYVSHPADPGGETNYGISKRAYPHEDIRGMTRARAAQIYRRDYWNAVRGDDLPAGLDLVAFDAAVNSGVSRGARWLQQALGVAADGKIGPVTIGAAQGAQPGTVITPACDLRLEFLRGLGTWGTFGKGWTKRVEAVRREASAMASALQPAPAAPQTETSTATIIAVVIVLAMIAAFILLRG